MFSNRVTKIGTFLETSPDGQGFPPLPWNKFTRIKRRPFNPTMRQYVELKKCSKYGSIIIFPKTVANAFTRGCNLRKRGKGMRSDYSNAPWWTRLQKCCFHPTNKAVTDYGNVLLSLVYHLLNLVTVTKFSNRQDWLSSSGGRFASCIWRVIWKWYDCAST